MLAVRWPLTDLHSHILPGVDDGAADLAAAIAMAKAALADGVGCIAATPHSLRFPEGVDPAGLEARVASLQEHLEAEQLPLRVVVGVEMVIIVALPQQIDAGRVVGLNRSRYLLLEMPLVEPPPQLEDPIFQVQVRGYVPILAHPERCVGLMRRLDALRPLVERGALVQITAGSLEGTFGRTAQEAAQRLLAAGLAHVIASDAHDAEHRPPRLSRAEALAAAIVGPERAHALVATTPAAILNDQTLDVEPPRPAERRRWFGLLRR